MPASIVYKGRSNPLTWEIWKVVDGVSSLLDISYATRMTLDLGDTVIDSDDSPDAFDWSTNGANGELVLSLGGEDITAGQYQAHLFYHGVDETEGRFLVTKPIVIRDLS